MTAKTDAATQYQVYSSKGLGQHNTWDISSVGKRRVFKKEGMSNMALYSLYATKEEG